MSCLDEVRVGLGLGDAVRGGLSWLVVVAHPDDETIGAGALIAALGASGTVSVLHTTDGSPHDLRDAKAAGLDSRDVYAETRRREAVAALALASVAPGRIGCLGFVDQELALALPAAARRLQGHIAEIAPDVVLTHAYEGGHPDHDSTAFAVHAALALDPPAGSSARRLPPVLVEMGLYHEHLGRIRRLAFPPGGDNHGVTCALDEASIERKRAMCDCYVSQREVLSGFPLDVERFRLAPRYHFTGPPLPGPLHYERFPWGSSGPRWRALAAQALQELALSSPI